MFSVIMPCHNPDYDQMVFALSRIHRQRVFVDEIIVIDDGSTPLSTDLIRDLCKKYSCQYERLENVMGARATNHGINLARGEWIHVHHPDDYVLDGFYDVLRQSIQTFPDAHMATTRHLICDEEGRPEKHLLMDWMKNGRMQPLHEGNPLAVIAVAVKRSAYKELGGWETRLTHTNDWEAWMRMSKRAVSADYPMACYRCSPANHTSRLMREADNLRDYLLLAEIVKEHTPEAVEDIKFRSYVAWLARIQVSHFRNLGDFTAAACNERFAIEIESTLPREAIKP